MYFLISCRRENDRGGGFLSDWGETAAARAHARGLARAARNPRGGSRRRRTRLGAEQRRTLRHLTAGRGKLGNLMREVDSDVGSINIVTTCYKGQINGVVLAGGLPRTLSRTLSVRHSIPVVVIADIWTSSKYKYAKVQFRKEVKVFIIEASSFEKLQFLMRQGLMSSIWWNHMASFIILDSSPDCANSGNYLYLAFCYDVLNAIAICNHHKRGIIVYNYNPYTSQAPVSWRRVKVIEGIYKHPFTVFSREYRENETICVDLNFVKTLDTGGYPMQVSDLEYEGEKCSIRSGWCAYSTTRARIVHTVIRAVNSTPRQFNPNGVRKRDMSFRIYLPRQEMEAGARRISYPVAISTVNIVTHFRGHKSLLNEILNILDVESWYGIALIYLITLIFLKIFVHQTLGQTLLNLVRLTCNMGVDTVPNNASSRIYLAALFFFVITMQVISQCDLAVMLTTQIPLPNIDTIKDLENAGYKPICTSLGFYRLFEGTELENYLIFDINDEQCIFQVRDNRSAAYVGLTNAATSDYVLKYGLRISSQPIEECYTNFIFRWQWPLEERVNTILARMVEASVLEPWAIKCKSLKASDFSVDLVVKNNEDFKSIELHEMLFSFVILAIGLTCSSIVFVIELAIGYKYRCGIKIWCHAVRR